MTVATGELEALLDLIADGGWRYGDARPSLAAGDPDRRGNCLRGRGWQTLRACVGHWRDCDPLCMEPTACPIGRDRSWELSCIDGRIDDGRSPYTEAILNDDDDEQETATMSEPTPALCRCGCGEPVRPSKGPLGALYASVACRRLAEKRRIAERKMQGRAEDSAQGCGHPKSDIVGSDEGTHYCGGCEREARSSTPALVLTPKAKPMVGELAELQARCERTEELNQELQRRNTVHAVAMRKLQNELEVTQRTLGERTQQREAAIAELAEARRVSEQRLTDEYDRHQAELAELRQQVSQIGQPPAASLEFDYPEPQDLPAHYLFLCAGYASARARQLLGSVPDEWRAE